MQNEEAHLQKKGSNIYCFQWKVFIYVCVPVDWIQANFS